MATLIETPALPPRVPPLPAREMTRCECAELPFEEVARRVREEGLTLSELGQRTGCAQTCTACRPDLQAFLARNQR